MEQGEHYKIDLTGLDPENAAVTKTTNGEDSFHIQGSGKYKPGEAEDPPGTGIIHPVTGEEEALKASDYGGADYYLHPGAISGIGQDGAGGTHGPRTGESPAVPPEDPLKQGAGIDPGISPGTLTMSRSAGGGGAGGS